MKQWNLIRKSFQKFGEGVEIISFIYSKEGKILREDRIAAEVTSENPLPPETLGWWRSVVRQRPPTQKELNERLERLFFSLKEATSPHKDALVWLVALYLTRKKILRQDGAVFTHVKTAEKFETNPSAIDPTQIESAMIELMEVIS